MSPRNDLPDGLIAYGPDANCTLALCPVTDSVYQYRPSLPANAVFIALFGIALFLHLIQGFRCKTWWFAACMMIGCVDEMIGYGGRIMLWKNPFDFTGFIMQIVTITFGPVFFTGAIYVTLSRIVIFLGEEYSRFSPNLFYWVFIPCDLVSLVLQAVGGSKSSNSSGSSKVGVDITLAGLAFQVATLIVFITLCVDYVLRWRKMASNQVLSKNFKIFATFLSISILLILIRCAYRIAELNNGYSGKLIRNETEFIILESCLITISAFTLVLAHPGPALDQKRATPPAEPKRLVSDDSETPMSHNV